MKTLILATFLIGLSLLPSPASGQAACDAEVTANVEVVEGEFSLAELLARSTCPALLHAASRVRLGTAPLPGSVRVLEGNEVRTLLQKVAASVENDLCESKNLRVPERVTVRRAGARANCTGIVGKIFTPLDAHPVTTESRFRDLPKPGAAEASPHETDCGAAGRLPQEARFELTRKVWNPALGTWDLFARCLDPSDCVPFLVRMPSHDLPQITAAPRTVASLFFTKASVALSRRVPLVRPGETVSLLWDQDGIRLVIPAVSLDAGGPGEAVRARVARGGRVVHAIVVSAGQLRAAS